jgi:DNA-binding transcriptional LysR family regulator
LERLLGLKLIERITRGAIPSDSGRALLDVARRILGDIDIFETSAHALSCGRAERIVIGVSASLCVGNRKCMLSDYLDHFSELHFAGVEAGSERLCSGLQSRTIDIAIHSGKLSGTELVKRALWYERLMLALPQEHPLAAAAQIYWNDLRGETSLFQT